MTKVNEERGGSNRIPIQLDDGLLWHLWGFVWYCPALIYSLQMCSGFGFLCFVLRSIRPNHFGRVTFNSCFSCGHIETNVATRDLLRLVIFTATFSTVGASSMYFNLVSFYFCRLALVGLLRSLRRLWKLFECWNIIFYHFSNVSPWSKAMANTCVFIFHPSPLDATCSNFPPNRLWSVSGVRTATSFFKARFESLLSLRLLGGGVFSFTKRTDRLSDMS